MKVIISHDVDHVTVSEHFRDLIVPKYLVRNTLELVIKNITIREYVKRFFKLFTNKWQNIEELSCFNSINGVKATFFVGVNNGKGLSYSLKKADKWIQYLLLQNIPVGVHGINYKTNKDIKYEFNKFKLMINQVNFGIRMHYLRTNDSTFANLSQVGYKFDSSLMEMRNVFKIGNMYEFPLHIMDGVICGNRKFSNVSLEEAKNRTLSLIQKAKDEDIKYLTVLFHDRYFDDSFSTWKEWYKWLIRYLKDEGYQFVNYNDAIKELESNERK